MPFATPDSKESLIDSCPGSHTHSKNSKRPSQRHCGPAVRPKQDHIWASCKSTAVLSQEAPSSLSVVSAAYLSETEARSVRIVFADHTVPAGPNFNDQTPKQQQQQQQQVVVLQEGYNSRGIGTVGTFIERHRCQSTVIWHTAGHTAQQQQDVDEIDLEHDCQQQVKLEVKS